MLERFEHTRVAEQIVHQLLEAIVNRTLRPGERLPSERSLSSRLGVNRASLREAIKRLEQMGLVHTRQGDGTRVMDFMSHAGLELLKHIIPLASSESLALRRDLQEVRVVLGREVARLAALRCEPEDLAELRRLQQRSLSQPLFPEDLLQLDMEVFAALARASHNQVVQLLVNSIRAAVSFQPALFVPLIPEAKQVLEYHRALMDLLAARDLDGSAELTESYLGRMVERL